MPSSVRSLLSREARLVEVSAGEHDLGAETFHRRDFVRIGAFGCVDDRPHAEFACRVGDRLSMVAGRRRYHASLALGARETAHQIEAAADLERADRLEVLALEEGRKAKTFVDRGPRNQRSRLKVLLDDSSRT